MADRYKIDSKSFISDQQHGQFKYIYVDSPQRIKVKDTVANEYKSYNINLDDIVVDPLADNPVIGTSQAFLYAGTPSSPFVTERPDVYGPSVEKFPFSITSGTITSIGEIGGVNYQHNHVSHGAVNSQTDGFIIQGTRPTINLAPPFVPSSSYHPGSGDPFPFTSPSDKGVIKIPFSMSGDIEVNEVVDRNPESASVGVSSPDEGYIIGKQAQFNKFPYAITSGSASDTGELLDENPSGIDSHRKAFSSSDSGFFTGTNVSPTGPYQAGSQLFRFPFAISSGTSVSSIGYAFRLATPEIPLSIFDTSSISSRDHGYIVNFPYNISTRTPRITENQPVFDGESDGPYASWPPYAVPSAMDRTTIIHRFPFAMTDGRATEVENIQSHYATGKSGAHSDGIYGYLSGGDAEYIQGPFPVGPITTPESSYVIPYVSSHVQKFPFSISSADQQDIGELSSGKRYSGQQFVD